MISHSHKDIHILLKGHVLFHVFKLERQVLVDAGHVQLDRVVDDGVDLDSVIGLPCQREDAKRSLLIGCQRRGDGHCGWSERLSQVDNATPDGKVPTSIAAREAFWSLCWCLAFPTSPESSGRFGYAS